MVAELQSRARGTRSVRVIDIGDGMARLLADLPAVLAHAIHDLLTQMAHEVRAAASEAEAAQIVETAEEVARPPRVARPGVHDGRVVAVTGPAIHGAAADSEPRRDDRTMDELRADILADLVLTGTPECARRGRRALDDPRARADHGSGSHRRRSERRAGTPRRVRTHRPRDRPAPRRGCARLGSRDVPSPHRRHSRRRQIPSQRRTAPVPSRPRRTLPFSRLHPETVAVRSRPHARPCPGRRNT